MFGTDDEHEPPTDGEQFDAVTRFEEPAEPGAGDPEQPIPEAPDPGGGGDVHPRIRRLFWVQVLVFKAAILAIAVGLALVAFGEGGSLGWQVVALGVVLLGFFGYRLRRARAEIDDLVDEGADEAAEDPETG